MELLIEKLIGCKITEEDIEKNMKKHSRYLVEDFFGVQQVSDGIIDVLGNPNELKKYTIIKTIQCNIDNKIFKKIFLKNNRPDILSIQHIEITEERTRYTIENNDLIKREKLFYCFIVSVNTAGYDDSHTVVCFIDLKHRRIIFYDPHPGYDFFENYQSMIQTILQEIMQPETNLDDFSVYVLFGQQTFLPLCTGYSFFCFKKIINFFVKHFTLLKTNPVKITIDSVANQKEYTDIKLNRDNAAIKLFNTKLKDKRKYATSVAAYFCSYSSYGDFSAFPTTFLDIANYAKKIAISSYYTCKNNATDAANKNKKTIVLNDSEKAIIDKLKSAYMNATLAVTEAVADSTLITKAVTDTNDASKITIDINNTSNSAFKRDANGHVIQSIINVIFTADNAANTLNAYTKTVEYASKSTNSAALATVDALYTDLKKEIETEISTRSLCNVFYDQDFLQELFINIADPDFFKLTVSMRNAYEFMRWINGGETDFESKDESSFILSQEQRENKAFLRRIKLVQTSLFHTFYEFDFDWILDNFLEEENITTIKEYSCTKRNIQACEDEFRTDCKDLNNRKMFQKLRELGVHAIRLKSTDYELIEVIKMFFE